MLWQKMMDDIDWADTQALVDGQVEENQHLEFKRELPGNDADGRKKFLRSVCAFANRVGGDIVYGITEEEKNGTRREGVAAGFYPLSEQQVNGIDTRLNNIVLDNIEPYPLIKIKSINNDRNEWCVVLRVMPSHQRPHSVWYNKRRHFTTRHLNITADLDMDEIRDLFLGSDALAERVRAFLAERLQLLEESESPRSYRVPKLYGQGRLVSHVVPLDTFGRRQIISTDRMQQSKWPMFESSIQYLRSNQDGLLIMNGGNPDTRVDPMVPVECGSTVQVFHNGVIEVVRGNFVRLQQTGFEGEKKSRCYDPEDIDTTCRETFTQVIECLDALGAELNERSLRERYALFVSLFAFAGIRPCSRHWDYAFTSAVLDRHAIRLLDTRVDAVGEIDAKLDELVRSLMWALGLGA